jgi:NADH:ubiquinone reductase (H+-translocating)
VSPPSRPPHVPRVVCLGGGWAAIYLAKALRGAVRRGEVELTVVSRENFHTFHGFIAEMLTGRLQPNVLLTPARRVFRGATFLCAEVDAIDPEARRVRIVRRMDGNPYELAYDHLVLGLGTVDDLARYPGLSEHTHKLKSFWECFRLRTHFLTLLEMAELEQDPEERRRLLTFTIIGGGYGGIEVAGELMTFLRELAGREYPRIHPDELRVIVIHSGPRILPELEGVAPSLVTYAEKHLARLGVDVRCGERIVAATAEEAVLSDGTRIGTRTIVSSAGTAVPRVLRGLPFEADARGRLITDPFLRIPGWEGVWAAGDCAAVPHPKGGTCPTVATYAMAGGFQVGVNLLRQVRGRPLRPFWFRGLGDACVLGGRKAVTQVMGIRLSGTLGWVVWRSIFLFFIPTLDRRIRILMDWALTALFGRDVVDVRIQDAQGIRPMRFEPGQSIVRQGEVGQTLYVIRTGEVEVVRQEGDGTEHPLARLGPGDHFGEVAVFQGSRRNATVRALTPVEVLAMGRADALSLSGALPAFGDQIRESPGGAA